MLIVGCSTSIHLDTWIHLGQLLALDVMSCVGQVCTPDLPRRLLLASSLSPTSPFCPPLFSRI